MKDKKPEGNSPGAELPKQWCTYIPDRLFFLVKKITRLWDSQVWTERERERERERDGLLT